MIELRAGRLRCELLPQLGGCIAGLWLGEQPDARAEVSCAAGVERSTG